MRARRVEDEEIEERGEEGRCAAACVIVARSPSHLYCHSQPTLRPPREISSPDLLSATGTKKNM